MPRIALLLLGLVSGIGIGLAGGYAIWFEELPADAASVQRPVIPAPVTQTVPPLNAFDALTRRITALMDAGNHATAIDLLIEADLLAATSEELARLESLLDDAVAARVRRLSALGQPAEIDSLYERLSLTMPERAEFYILLAEHRIEMGNPEAALPVLAQIENHDRLGALARDLIEQITSAGVEGDFLASLPLTRAGDQYIVEASLDGSRQVRLLIDTGASMTTLMPDILSDLGYPLDGPKANFSTANGIVQAPVVRLGKLSLGPATVGAVTVGALPFEGPRGEVDGLLGMNVLRHFEFSLDQAEARLHLISSRTD